MKLKKFEHIKFTDGGVCAAKGFKANGIQCGLAHKPLAATEDNSQQSVNVEPEKKKNDLAVIFADKMCTAAAVYTLSLIHI